MRSVCSVALAAVIALTMTVGADNAQDAERLLKAAMNTELVDGNLKAAIEQYKKVAQSGNRPLAAQALLHMAECYQKLGDTEARQIFERIARDFGDQRDIAAQARDRLAALRGLAAGRPNALTARQVVCCWRGGNAGLEASPSPDGRSVTMVHWDSGDLAVRDLDTGGIARFGLKKGWESSDFAQEPVFSHDQHQIAFTWFSAADQKYQLRVIAAEPGSKPRVLVAPSEVSYFTSSNWSPDGKTIFTLIADQKDSTSRIASVSTADGTLKTLKSLEWRQPHGLSLSPDGRYLAYDVLEHQDSTDRDVFILASNGTSETAAVRNPGVDSNPVWTPDGNRLIFTSNRSGSSGLYALDVREGKPQGAPTLIKPDVGRIWLRGFARSGTLYYLQTTSDLNVYRAELDSIGTVRGVPAALATTYIGNNSQAALSADGKQVAYLSFRGAPRQFGVQGGAGAWTVVVKPLTGPGEKTYLATQDVRSIHWLPDGRGLLLVARDPQRRRPLLYKLDLESGRFSPLPFEGSGVPPTYEYFPINGISAMNLASGDFKSIYHVDGDRRVWDVSLSPDGRMFAVLVGASGPQQTRGVALIAADGSPVRTLLEQPYNGHDPVVWPGGGVAWSSDGRQVFFVRQGPAGQGEVYRVPAAGGEPAPTGIRGEQLTGIRVTGNALIYTAGVQNQVELWEFDNLLSLLKSSR